MDDLNTKRPVGVNEPTVVDDNEDIAFGKDTARFRKRPLGKELTREDIGLINDARNAYEKNKRIFDNPEDTKEDKRNKIWGNVRMLKIQADTYREKAEKTDDEKLKSDYNSLAAETKIIADEMRVEFLDEAPENEEVLAAMDREGRSNPLVMRRRVLDQLERFIEWVKRNLSRIAAITGSVAGIASFIGLYSQSSNLLVMV